MSTNNFLKIKNINEKFRKMIKKNLKYPKKSIKKTNSKKWRIFTKYPEK